MIPTSALRKNQLTLTHYRRIMEKLTVDMGADLPAGPESAEDKKYEMEKELAP